MTRAELISKLLDTAHGVCHAYYSDCRHDVRQIAQAEPGDVFMWRPYKMGTHFLTVWRDIKPNRKAAHMFHVMQSCNRSAGYAEDGWRLIRIGSVDCAMIELTSDEAASRAWEALRESEKPCTVSVSEIHL